MAAPNAMMSGALQSSPVKNNSAYNPQNDAVSDVASEAQIIDEDTEDDEEVLRPRGRLAARMLDKNALYKEIQDIQDIDIEASIMQAISDSEFENEMDIEDARKRRRNRLLGITSSDEDEMSSQSESEDEDAVQRDLMTARERLLKTLAMEQKLAQDEQAEHKSIANSDDEEDVAVPSRKRHRIPQNGSPKPSPVASPQFSRESLFVSPNKVRSPAPGGSDSEDLPAAPLANPRFMALVAKKRQERLANEAALAEKKKMAEERHSSLLENDDISGSDDDGGRRLTQQVRPTRKASKKALEEMHRETQRMSRNMQLAHQAKTKKKITKSSLFAKFNYKPEGFVEETTASSSPPRTDVEMHDTPPTSPLSPSLAAEKSMSVEAAPAEVSLPLNSESANEAELPSLQDVLSSQHVPSSPLRRKADKGKGKAVQQSPSPKNTPPFARQMTVRVRAPAADAGDDSDDDLEIITSKTPVKSKVKRDLDSIFDRVPARKARESTGLHALRLLAHLGSPTRQTNKKNAKPSITNSELQASLQQRARQQAAREREERLQALRDRGIIVPTAEEREKELGEVEDLMAKARREGEELAKGEKAAAKKERKENGEMDPLDMDSSGDEEWQEEVEKFSQQMSPSGSEDEGDDERDDDEDVSGEDDENEDMEDAGPLNKNEVATPNPLVCDEASDSESPEDEDVVDDEAGDFINGAEEEEAPNVTSRRRTKNTNVISDDEDDDISTLSPQPLPMDTPGSRKTATTSPLAPMSVLRSATKTFIPGVTVAGPAGLSLTQIFAGTMDDSQQDFDATPMDSPSQRFDSQADSMAFLRNLPPPEFPDFAPTVEEDSQDVVESSQIQIDHIPATQPTQAETQGIQLSFSQSQIHGFDSLVDPSQYSEFPEATQDEGFSFMSPIVGRFTQPRQSTVDTVMLDSTPAPDPTPETIEESPMVKRKGKLRRRIQAPVLSDDEEVEPTDDFEITSNVFDTMRKASKSKAAVLSDFDKKKSGAKEMVQEQASESEDEYAGLGGASDDESDGENEADQAMIDDENRGDFDERKLAAFYADRERAADEQQVNKLFKDITSGMLRKKRGADYDLSDSDDDGEARRRMKRREFAKMRKALLADERLGQIAENPKRAAFLRAIEDRGDEDDAMDFLDDEIVPAEHAASSQPVPADEESQDAVTSVPNSQPDTTAAAMGPPKRKAADEPEPRLPPHLRRTHALAAKRPSSLSEIRASLSSLIDDPNAAHSGVGTAEDSDSDLDIEGAPDAGKGSGKENNDPFAPRRAGTSAVVDRISLKRASSSSLSGSTRLAFAAGAGAGGFKVPALLRRATTNSSSSTAGEGAAERRMGDSKAAPKKGKGVAFYTREEERTAVIKEGEKKRQEKLFRGVEGRRKVVGGLFARGSFA